MLEVLERVKLTLRKLIWSAILVLWFLAYLKLKDADIPADPTPMTILVIGIFQYPLAFWFCTLLPVSLFLNAWSCKYKTYQYYDLKISVYAGYFHHYIAVNGQKMDEHNTFQSYAPVYLSCTLEDGTLLDAKISTGNHIVLKINDRLYKKGF